MPSIITIQGADLSRSRSKSKSKRKRNRKTGLGAAGPNLGASANATVGDCKCVWNPRNSRWAELCYVGKSSKSRTGWKFVRGGAERCKGKSRR